MPLGAELGDIDVTDMEDAAAPPVATTPAATIAAVVVAVSITSTAKENSVFK